MGKCFEAYVCGPCRARKGDISNYSWWCCVQSQFSETDLEAKHKWIYAVVPLSVGPVGPGGGIYSSTEDVLCRVNFRKMIWRPNNRGLDICSSAFVCGPCRAWWWDIFNYRLCCVQSLFSDGPSWPCIMLTKWELDHWHIDQVRSWTTGNLTKNFSTTSMRHLPMGTVS